MKTLSVVAIALALLSIALSAYLALSDPAARAQALSFEFPLSGMGEATFYMLGPIVVSAISILAAIPAFKQRSGQVAIAASLVSWAVIWTILGVPRFRYLF